MTLYEKIKNKSPEELAKMISEHIDCGSCETMNHGRPCDYECCPDFWLKRLNTEVPDAEA